MGWNELSCNPLAASQALSRVVGFDDEPMNACTAAPQLHAESSSAAAGLNFSMGADVLAVHLERGRSRVEGMRQKMGELRGGIQEVVNGDPELHDTNQPGRISPADVEEITEMLDRAEGHLVQAEEFYGEAETSGEQWPLVKGNAHVELAGLEGQQAQIRTEISDWAPIASEEPEQAAPADDATERVAVTHPDAEARSATRWPSPATAVLGGLGLATLAVLAAPVEVPAIAIGAAGAAAALVLGVDPLAPRVSSNIQ